MAHKRTVRDSILDLISAPLLAVGFLTVVPLPRMRRHGDMGWTIASFPLIGAALGGCVGLAGAFVPLPASVVAALQLAALLAATGALHLDALMDSFDGLFVGKDFLGRLAIMRDSRVGSYGIAAAISVILIEYGSLTSLAADLRLQAPIVAVCLSRWAMAAALWAFPGAARDGLAAGLKPKVIWYHAATATVLAFGVAVLVSGWVGLGAIVLASMLVFGGGRLAVSRIGGVTGDICGGLGQMTEAAVLVSVVALGG